MQDSALRGFKELGIETQPYTWIDDIDTMTDLGPEVGVSGYVGDVLKALDRIGVKRPEPVDYPEVLQQYLCRKVWKGTASDVTSQTRPLFIKPVQHKLFTGFVWRPKNVESRSRLASVSEDEPVWISEVVDMRSEYRAFVLRGDLIDVRRYKGDWDLVPNRKIVEGAVQALGAPIASYCLDFAVSCTGATSLVEMNSFAFGHVGLKNSIYAEMLAARWEELAQGPKSYGC